jgi:hypothetical protein
MKMEKKPYEKRQMLFWRYVVLILLIGVTIGTLPSTVHAHPPSTMTVAYNLETQDLYVNLTHQVSDPATHYISLVEIKKNGAIYNTSFYTDQPTPNSFSYTYKVNATAGDVIEVYADCNLGGSRTVQYTITEDNGENDKSTPGFALIIFLGAVVISFLVLRKRHS